MARFKVTINEVTSWEEGNESAADWSHGVPTSQIKRAMADEYEEKVETDKWQKKMEAEGKMPFVYETEEGETDSEEEAKDFALQDLYDELCKYDYYEPIDCDCEVEEIED